MSAIHPQTRSQIKGYLEGFIQGLVDEYRGREIVDVTDAREYFSRTSPKGQLKPFQAALLPPNLIRVNQFERGLSTRLGTSLEECARLIALDRYAEVRRGYDLRGIVSDRAFAEAERQKQNYESASKSQGQKPSLTEMIAAVLNARDREKRNSKVVRADLYLIDRDGTEFLFEIKSPKPNKGQCLEVLQRLLRFHALRGQHRPQLQAYYAMPYNPYGATRASYRWTQAKNYLPFDEAVIIGRDFWTLIGGENTYEELLDVYIEVGRDKSKAMLDALAFGF